MTRVAKAKLLPIIYTLLLLIIIFLGWSNYQLFENRYITKLSLDESELLTRGSSVFSRELGHIKSSTLFLRNSVLVQLSAYSGNPPTEEKWQADMVQVFTRFAQTSPLISQVRWLSSQGKELIRINVSNGRVELVPQSQLQNKASRYYFQQAQYATGNNVYISPVDLNVENGQIVKPIEPTVRGVTLLDSVQKGVLVVNYNLAPLFDQLRNIKNQDVFLDIVNPHGEWVVSQDPKQEWTSTLRHESKLNPLLNQYPNVWGALLSNQGLAILQTNGQIWSGMKVMVEDDNAQMNEGKSSYLYFISRSQQGILHDYKYTLFWTISGIGLFAYVLIGWFVWWQLNAAYHRRELMLALEREKAQLKSANDELTLMNHQLVELQNELVEASKLSALGMMVAGLAHEMNTPLGGVKMSLSSLSALLKRETENISEKSRGGLQSSIKIAEKNLNRAIALVASFKRLTSHRTGHEVEFFKFNEVIHDLLVTYDAILKKSIGIHIVCEFEPDIQMRGFPGILSQVIQNFLDNALQHGFKDRPKGEIKLTATLSKPGWLKLTIEDNGKGISPSVAEHLFEPFVTTGRSEKHTGLGLHLVHQWVHKLMKGHIDVSSVENAGTCFTLWLPLDHDKAKPVKSTH